MASRRDLLKAALGIASGMGAARILFPTPAHAEEAAKGEEAKSVPPDVAVSILREGNRRFVEMKRLPDPGVGRKARKILAGGQRPLAAVLSCADSRVPPEIIFDQGLGRLYTIRNAGPLVEPFVLGSIEHAVEHLGVRLILVLGHGGCDVMARAVRRRELGGGVDPKWTITLLNSLMPAVDRARALTRKFGKALSEEAAKENVRMAVAQIASKSEVVKKALDQGRIKIVGGFYHLETGVAEIWA